MAKSFYSFEKRKQELKKQKKREEKLQRKLQKGEGEEGTPGPEDQELINAYLGIIPDQEPQVESETSEDDSESDDET